MSFQLVVESLKLAYVSIHYFILFCVYYLKGNKALPLGVSRLALACFCSPSFLFSKNDFFKFHVVSVQLLFGTEES